MKEDALKMEAKAYLKYLRISPRKVVILCDLIRGKDVKTAAAYLMQTPKAASEPMLKLLKSAIANAENNHGMDVDKLYVSTALADPGPTLKRGMPRAQGRFNLPHAQARHAQSTGQIQSYSEENHSHHHRCEREGLSRRLLWDRKLIPMDCALA